MQNQSPSDEYLLRDGVGQPISSRGAPCADELAIHDSRADAIPRPPGSWIGRFMLVATNDEIMGHACF